MRLLNISISQFPTNISSSLSAGFVTFPGFVILSSIPSCSLGSSEGARRNARRVVVECGGAAVVNGASERGIVGEDTRAGDGDGVCGGLGALSMSVPAEMPVLVKLLVPDTVRVLAAAWLRVVPVMLLAMLID